MTVIYSSNGTRYSLESPSDVSALIQATRGDEKLADRIRRFSPNGEWCIPDESGGYKTDANGDYLTESLSAEGIANYWRVRAALEKTIPAEPIEPAIECQRIEPEGQLWERCPSCGREPVYMPLHLCLECWPKSARIAQSKPNRKTHNGKT